MVVSSPKAGTAGLILLLVLGAWLNTTGGVEAQLAEVQPLIDAARAAVGGIKADHINEVTTEDHTADSRHCNEPKAFDHSNLGWQGSGCQLWSCGHPAAGGS